MDIYPSILETSFADFEKSLANLLPLFPHFQIDIADGIFVPNKTVQIEEINHVTRNLKHETFLRSKTFEIHLMVKDYQRELNKIKKLANVIPITSVLIHLKVLFLRYKLHVTRYKIGIVLDPNDSVIDNWGIIKHFPIVQIMTVNPGKQGNPFLPEALTKIDELRENGFSGKIILDGGITDTTVPIILSRENKPDAVCPGSYFKENTEEKLLRLEKLLTTDS